MASLKLVLFSVLALAVDVSHEKQQPTSNCPSECLCFTQDVISINCSGKNLTEVVKPPLGVDTDTRTLILANNRITHVDLTFLKHYPNLKLLSLRSNGVRALSKKSEKDFVPFFQLAHIDLSDNAMHVIHPYIFSGFPNLKTLNLSGNVLHTISDNAFTLPSLETLDLSRNQLGVIKSHFFSSSSKLTEIDLSKNGISRLNNGDFGTLSHLALIDLSHNSFMIIEDNVFVGMNVTHLDLGYNSLRRPPKHQLQKLSFAKTLILDGNPFTVLDKESLKDVRAEFVSISKCPGLTRIQEIAIQDMPLLKTLTINGNMKLTFIDSNFITESPNLEALDLSNNNLFAVEGGIVNLPKLRALYLSGNSFNCHCSLSWIAKIVEQSSLRIMDLDSLFCRKDDNKIPLDGISQKMASECEPYILPLFETLTEKMMGKNVSWLCKALGSSDVDIKWRIPSLSIVLGNGQCSKDGRHCVSNGVLTVRYLHPSDSGKYVCVAKSKYGQDQRDVVLNVKVREYLFNGILKSVKYHGGLQLSLVSHIHIHIYKGKALRQLRLPRGRRNTIRNPLDLIKDFLNYSHQIHKNTK